ncbi:MAG: hypothetical protein ACSHX0_11980 [Akkermansiaceae bacterium]
MSRNQIPLPIAMIEYRAVTDIESLDLELPRSLWEVLLALKSQKSCRDLATRFGVTHDEIMLIIEAFLCRGAVEEVKAETLSYQEYINLSNTGARIDSVNDDEGADVFDGPSGEMAVDIEISSDESPQTEDVDFELVSIIADSEETEALHMEWDLS